MHYRQQYMYAMHNSTLAPPPAPPQQTAVSTAVICNKYRSLTSLRHTLGVLIDDIGRSVHTRHEVPGEASYSCQVRLVPGTSTGYWYTRVCIIWYICTAVRVTYIHTGSYIHIYDDQVISLRRRSVWFFLSIFAREEKEQSSAARG